MIPATALADLRGAPEVTGNHQQDLFTEPTLLNILQEGRNGLVHGWTKHLHPLDHPGVVAVGVHVPPGAMHRHKAGPGLTEPPGEEHLLTKGAGPVAAMPDLYMAGVVFLHQPGIFKSQVKRPGRATKQHGARLGRQLVHRPQRLAAIQPPPKGVDGVE